MMFNELIDDSGLSALSDFIGQKLYVVYCPSMEVEDGVISSSSFSIATKHSWVNFTNSWCQTSNDNNYFRLGIEQSTHPFSLKYNPIRKEFSEPVCSFLFNRTLNENWITKIEIHAKRDVWHEESLFYDFAIVFTSSNGFRFCLKVRDDITDRLECTTVSELIESILSSLELRKVID